MAQTASRALYWCRLDCRTSDNPALFHASTDHASLLILYILDETDPYFIGGAEMWWLHHSLNAFANDLKKLGGELILKRGDPKKIIPKIVKNHEISAVYWNRLYEPHALSLESTLKNDLQTLGATVSSYNASLLNEPWSVMNKAGSYFKVFTPYWRAALQLFQHSALLPAPKKLKAISIDSDNLESWQLLPKHPDWAKGFKARWQVGEKAAHHQLENFLENLQGYQIQKDFPAQDATSKLSPYLHFGEISVHQIVHAVMQLAYEHPKYSTDAEFYIRSLYWREFSTYLLYHFPSLPEKNFNADFDKFVWHEDLQGLKAWQKGQTGFPMIDAGMRELWQTGSMHNRVRMLVASFLTKNLLIHWQVGAAWFWDTLVDADLGNNAASWQWVAGSGVDAAPYFRIFNPVSQGEKFDKDGEYIARYVPELARLPGKYRHQPWAAPESALQDAGVVLGKTYPERIVDLKVTRERALGLWRRLRSR